MPRRFVVITLVLAGVGAIPATPAAAVRSCGPLTLKNGVVQHVKIVRGHASCREAVRVIRALYTGHATPHGPGIPLIEDYATVSGGWQCHSAAGGTVCVRGASVLRNAGKARDEITASEPMPRAASLRSHRPPARVAGATTWMTGPGCGRTEWRQHPAAFPYFCDGAAVVERASWSNWGRASATAHATMNEADLHHGTSVGTAPRIRSAVTVTATHIEICGGRRTYTSVTIRYDHPRTSLSTLRLALYLPSCHPLTQAGQHLHYFVSPDRAVWCSAEQHGSFCDVGNFWNNGFHSGELGPGGRVSVCNHSTTESYCGALGGGSPPVLQYGQSTELAGVRCVSAVNGISCTTVAGPAKGRGFRVNKTEAVEIG